MEEFTFDATVAERWPRQVQIVPDDWPAFVEYIRRSGITTDIHWHPDRYVSVGESRFVEIARDAERVRYTIRPKGTLGGRRIEAVSLVRLV